MKNTLPFTSIMIAVALSANLASANVGDTPSQTNADADARIQVEWVNPKKFTDLSDRMTSSEKFRTHAIKSFEKHFTKLAQNLPEGQSLKLKITDVDLAGRIEPGSFSGLVNTTDNIRIMRNLDIPRIKFEYALMDASGAVIKEEEVKLKDMNYLNAMRPANHNRPFVYEKRMLTRWFNQNLKDA